MVLGKQDKDKLNRHARPMGAPSPEVPGWEPCGEEIDQEGPYSAPLGEDSADQLVVRMGRSASGQLVEFAIWQETRDLFGNWQKVVVIRQQARLRPSTPICCVHVSARRRTYAA